MYNNVLMYNLMYNNVQYNNVHTFQAQLCALRRISRNYDECSDSVILMNKRLAEDNTLISANLSAIKKELKSVNQVCSLFFFSFSKRK